MGSLSQDPTFQMHNAIQSALQRVDELPSELRQRIEELERRVAIIERLQDGN